MKNLCRALLLIAAGMLSASQVFAEVNDTATERRFSILAGGPGLDQPQGTAVMQAHVLATADAIRAL
ncbi:hypothetical protein GTP46_14830 [Duganella sp. FT135W]|uniref:Uncharacterized protein n=1 Tax=Duganella flavida TaxID=2692175 RepID=A0A6L8KA70_9BURK|nr:hypothetical protein [Duganella flavida]MYM23925.1 hypothetical protein [Duganella flavida]